MKITPQIAEKLAELKIRLWLKLYGIKTEAGEPLDFYEHLYLLEPFADFRPKQVYYKAAQIGFTTLAILKSFWVVKHKKIDAIYTLPSQSDIYEFLAEKINRLVAQNPILRQYISESDTVDRKRVGDNVIYYRGTWTEKSALMIPSDLNIVDEYDRSKAEVVEQYASRLQHSKYKWEWFFSNPSVQGHGVSKYWPKSDQKHWFIKCGGCKKEQDLTWPESIDPDRKEYICKFCQKVLTREERRVGRWIPQNPGAEWSGYWISLLMTPWTTAAQILEYYETKPLDYFYNFVLGLPYVGEGNIVTPDVIFRNLTHETNSQEQVVIGCDSGLKKHFVVGNKEGLFYYGVADDWKEIEGLMRRFDRAVLVIDALPDLTEPRRLREKYPGRVFLCHYARDRKTFRFIRWGENEEYGNVVADRNRMIQLVIDEFAAKRIPLQGIQSDWEQYYSHWNTLYRQTENDALGVPQMMWESSSGKDHFCHATVYWRVGMDKFSTGDGRVLGTNVLPPVSAFEQTYEETMPAAPIVNPKTFFKWEKEGEDWRDA